MGRLCAQWVASQGGPLAFLAVLGAVIGWGMSADLDWSATAGQHECAQASGVCIGVAPVAGLGLAAARLRPLALTVPAAIALLPLITVVYLDMVPGGRLHPAWLLALATALVFAALAIVVTAFGERGR